MVSRWAQINGAARGAPAFPTTFFSARYNYGVLNYISLFFADFINATDGFGGIFIADNSEFCPGFIIEVDLSRDLD